MWIEETKDGYRYIEKYKDPLTDEWKRTSVVRPTKSKADKNLAYHLLMERIEQLTEEQHQYQFTLKEISEAYLEWQKDEHKEQSAVNAADECKRLLEKLNPRARANELTAVYVRSRLKGKPSTYNIYLSRFKAMMRWAFENDYVEDVRWMDKLKKAKVPPIRVKNATKYLEHDEITALMKGMTNERWKLMTEFLILSGLRVGEAIALNDSDVTDVIKVEKTLSAKTKKLSTAKTDSSAREVFVQDELADCVRRIRIWRAKEMMANGYRTEIFFPNHNGTYCGYPAYSLYFHDTTEKLIGRAMPVHSTRHTHVAMMAEAGLTLPEIARRVGHADSKITQDIYYHVTAKVREKDFERQKKIKII